MPSIHAAVLRCRVVRFTWGQGKGPKTRHIRPAPGALLPFVLPGYTAGGFLALTAGSQACLTSAVMEEYDERAKKTRPQN